MARTYHCDVAIVGGGLAGGLIALALRTTHPDLEIRLIDAADTIGGNHIWSFFGSDVAEVDRWLVAPLVTHAWPAYDVAFPAHARTIRSPYYSIESERLDRVVRRALPNRALMLGRRVLSTTPTSLVLADGEGLEVGGVIDARGVGNLALMELGWQKFVGCELALEAPHGVERPVVMDATVEQIDGYRFVYCLPFAPDRMFVEDTYYSDSPQLDRPAVLANAKAYAADRGWRATAATREESGVLPVVIGGDFERYWRSGGEGVAKAGMRAGLFHPTTGYSLPDAVRTATAIAASSDLSGEALHALTYGLAQRMWRQRGFYRMLDAMLFFAAEPEDRFRVLERFYRLNPGLIGRFYAGQATLMDKARILTGKPPVPIPNAVAAILGGRRR